MLTSNERCLVLSANGETEIGLLGARKVWKLKSTEETLFSWAIQGTESLASHSRAEADSSSSRLEQRRIIPQHNNAFKQQTTPTRTHYSTCDAGGHIGESYISHKRVHLSHNRCFRWPLLSIHTHKKSPKQSVGWDLSSAEATAKSECHSRGRGYPFHTGLSVTFRANSYIFFN